MAFKDYNRNPQGVKLPDFYNVSDSVGWISGRTGRAAVNMETDMMLVAYFLQYYYRYGDVHLKPSEIETIPMPGLIPEMMRADKKSTIGNLAYWIKRYQTMLLPYGYGITPDGRVDRALNSNYTICRLNGMCKIIIQTRFGQEDWMSFMLNDNPTLMPPMLKSELSYTF